MGSNKSRERTESDQKFLEQIGARIKHLREEYDVTLAEICVEMELSSTQSQSRREAGVSDFPLTDLKRYADFFDMSLPKFLKGVK